MVAKYFDLIAETQGLQAIASVFKKKRFTINTVKKARKVARKTDGYTLGVS